MALFLIKFTHSLVFIVESAAILYILYSGATGTRDSWLALSVIAVLLEVAVYVVNGYHCPMTRLAKKLGDPTGDDYIADIFLPKGFARLVPPVCGTLAAIGLLMVGARFLLAR